MAYIIDQGRCSGCQDCLAACPLAAIVVNASGRCQIEAAVCTDCGACADLCPAEAIRGG